MMTREQFNTFTEQLYAKDYANLAKCDENVCEFITADISDDIAEGLISLNWQMIYANYYYSNLYDVVIGLLDKRCEKNDYGRRLINPIDSKLGKIIVAKHCYEINELCIKAEEKFQVNPTKSLDSIESYVKLAVGYFEEYSLYYNIAFAYEKDKLGLKVLFPNIDMRKWGEMVIHNGGPKNVAEAGIMEISGLEMNLNSTFYKNLAIEEHSEWAAHKALDQISWYICNDDSQEEYLNTLLDLLDSRFLFSNSLMEHAEKDILYQDYGPTSILYKAWAQKIIIYKAYKECNNYADELLKSGDIVFAEDLDIEWLISFLVEEDSLFLFFYSLNEKTVSVNAKKIEALLEPIFDLARLYDKNIVDYPKDSCNYGMDPVDAIAFLEQFLDDDYYWFWKIEKKVIEDVVKIIDTNSARKTLQNFIDREVAEKEQENKVVEEKQTIYKDYIKHTHQKTNNMGNLDIQELMQQAQKGNSEANLTLGMLYLNGDTVKQDKEIAEKYFIKASEAGNIEAMYQHALMCYENAPRQILEVLEKKSYIMAGMNFSIARYFNHPKLQGEETGMEKDIRLKLKGSFITKDNGSGVKTEFVPMTQEEIYKEIDSKDHTVYWFLLIFVLALGGYILYGLLSGTMTI